MGLSQDRLLFDLMKLEDHRRYAGTGAEEGERNLN
jgi:hypothetical protein